jgi:hypothetical protein
MMEKRTEEMKLSSTLSNAAYVGQVPVRPNKGESAENFVNRFLDGFEAQLRSVSQELVHRRISLDPWNGNERSQLIQHLEHGFSARCGDEKVSFATVESFSDHVLCTAYRM